MFLETLVDFIQVHKEDLQDWLFVLLTQLLKKMGADLLGSVQAKVQKALDVTRLVSHLSSSFFLGNSTFINIISAWKFTGIREQKTLKHSFGSSFSCFLNKQKVYWN